MESRRSREGEGGGGGDDSPGTSSNRTHEVVIDLSLTGLVNDLTNPEPLLRDAETSYSFVSPSLEQVKREACREEAYNREGGKEGNEVTECSFVELHHAFTINDTDINEATLLERIGQHCRSSLGISMSDVELYELKPFRSSTNRSDDSGIHQDRRNGLHIGIRVRNAASSEASAPAEQVKPSEEVRPENSRLGVSPLQQHDRVDKTLTTGTALIGAKEAAVHGLHSEIIREHVELIAEKTMEARRWEFKAREMSQSNQKFKSQTQNLQRLLAKSELMWRKGQDALDSLKADFKALSVDIKDNEKLLWKKFDLTSPDKRLEHMNASTRKQLGSKNLSTLVKLLENQAALDMIEKLTSEPSIMNRIENATRF